MKYYNIAIDGPAGAGKSTIAKGVAKKLRFIYVDTGAMYRAMALYAIRQKVDPEDAPAITQACNLVHVTIEYMNGEQQVILNGENVTGLLRSEEVGKMASAVARHSGVRTKMVDLQRELAATANVIMDGRDIGTVVLPNADLKIYLTASSKERARRRYAELAEKGAGCDIHAIEQDIIARDNQDMNREISPLRQAADAVLIDSSDLSIDQVIDRIIELYHKKCEGK